MLIMAMEGIAYCGRFRKGTVPIPMARSATLTMPMVGSSSHSQSRPTTTGGISHGRIMIARMIDRLGQARHHHGDDHRQDRLQGDVQQDVVDRDLEGIPELGVLEELGVVRQAHRLGGVNRSQLVKLIDTPRTAGTA